MYKTSPELQQLNLLFLNTHDEKYTADSARMRPYSIKILSNFCQIVYTLLSDDVCDSYKNIYRLVATFINIWTTLWSLNSC